MSEAEETRARAYRQTIERRDANRIAAEKRLAGQEALRKNVEQAWEPIINRDLAGDDHRVR